MATQPLVYQDGRLIDKDTQQVCIDLPGEIVRCWRSTTNVEVLLRKHRDVIFDIRLGNGKSYTVEATESDFYNARDKKIVFQKRQGTVSFRDGERLHLWVSRGFRGALLVKCGAEVILCVEPNELDKHQPSDDPKEKPAPIIIAIGQRQTPPGNSVVPAKDAVPLTAKPKQTVTMPPSQPKPAVIQEIECPTICVVKGTIKDMPKKLFDYFQSGAGESGLADIDPNDAATRNWILGQLAGSAAYVGDNWKWLAASIDRKTHQGFRLVQAKVHYVKGQVRFYFSGFSKFNPIFGPGGHGPSHDRILTIFSGAGKTKSAFQAMAKGIAGTFKSNALVSFVFGSFTEYTEWKADLNKDGYDLAAALLMEALKAIVVAALVVVAVLALVALVLIATKIALAVVAVGAFTLAAAVGISYMVESADKHLGKKISADPNNTDGLAAIIAPWLRKAGEEIQESWQYLMKKFPNDYKALSFEKS